MCYIGQHQRTVMVEPLVAPAPVPQEQPEPEPVTVAVEQEPVREPVTSQS